MLTKAVTKIEIVTKVVTEVTDKAVVLMIFKLVRTKFSF